MYRYDTDVAKFELRIQCRLDLRIYASPVEKLSLLE